MSENLCVCCGKSIPEGTQVCPQCVKKTELKKEDFYTGYIIKNGIRIAISGTLEECGKKQCEEGVSDSHIWITDN